MNDTIADKAYGAILNRILNGEIAPGSYLIEQDLADDLGVSRTPVKTALRRLQAEGLIDAQGYKRARVREFNEQEISDILEIRSLLESYATRRAASRITEKQIAELERLAGAMEALADTEQPERVAAFSSLNDQFHQIILDASQNDHLKTVMKPILQMQVLLALRFQHRISVHLQRSCWHHREIIAALKERNEQWAMLQMQTHLYAASTWHPEQD